MLIIGRNPVIETLEYNPKAIRKIVLLEGINDKKVLEIVRMAGRKKIQVEQKSQAEFKKIFNEKNKSEGISQGVVAESEDFKYSEFEEVIKSSLKESIVVVLDEIQDPHNLGAIIRTAAASGVDAIIISEKNSAKVTHTVIKSSAGAVNFIPVVQAGNIYKTILALKELGFRVIGTAQRTGTEYAKYAFPVKCALVLGNEGEGIRKNIIKLCDDIIYIPAGGRVQSLNVSVAAGVLLYEARRHRDNSNKI